MIQSNLKVSFFVIFSNKVIFLANQTIIFLHFFSASVCGVAVASPGHPEPGEPPVSAGPVIRASICAAKMAAVHPVQDGSGGDSVV